MDDLRHYLQEPLTVAVFADERTYISPCGRWWLVVRETRDLLAVFVDLLLSMIYVVTDPDGAET